MNINFKEGEQMTQEIDNDILENGEYSDRDLDRFRIYDFDNEPIDFDWHDNDVDPNFRDD